MAEAQVFFDNPVTGKRQIDQTFKNLHLITKGTAEATLNAGGNQGLKYVDLTFNNCRSPLLAIYNPTLPVAWYRYSFNGTTWVWRVFSSGNSGTFEYYLFDTNPPPLNMGMELRNAASEVTFSLGYRPMRVAGVLMEPGLGNYAIGSSAQKFAYAPMRSGFTYNQGPGPGGSSVLVVTTVSATQAISGGVRIAQISTDAQEYNPSTNPAPTNPPTQTGSDWLILDVTGM